MAAFADHGLMFDRHHLYRVACWVVLCSLVACASPRPKPRQAAPSGPRNIAKMVDVDAPLSVVWSTWTTSGGLRTFLSPEANVADTVGGPFELLFTPSGAEGARGTEGCTLLASTPETRLTFEISFPPSLGLADSKTPVTVHLTALDDTTTRLKIVHQGFATGATWDDAHFYYSEFWSSVVERLRHRFEEGPTDWSTAGDHFEWR